MKHDPLGDMLKTLERTAETTTLRDGYLYMRLDGRGFSKLTKNAEKPFDAAFSQAMIDTTKAMVDTFHAACGYTQSDEISLIWEPRVDPDSWIFSGRRSKWLTVMAAQATAFFLKASLNHGMPWVLDHAAHMDARLVDGLTKENARDFILWRAEDARRNAIQMCAQAYLNKKSLKGQNLGILRKRLDENGTPFDTQPAALRNGTLVKRVMMPLSEERLASIPPAYRPTDTVLRPHILSDDSILPCDHPTVEDVLFT